MMSKLGLEGGNLGCQLGDLILSRHGEVLVLGVSRLNLSSTVRARPRPGAYKMSRCLRSSDISAGGHSKGTSPCWMTEQKMLLHIYDSMYMGDFT